MHTFEYRLHRCRPHAVESVLLIGLMHMAQPGHAAEWSIDGVVSTAAEFSSNPRLLADPSGSAAGTITELSTTFARRTARDALELSPKVVARAYTGDYQLDGVDTGLTMAYRRTSELSRLNLSVDYLSDNTSTSGFTTTGYTEKNIPRTTLAADVDYGRSISPRLEVGAILGWQSVDFDRGNRGGLVDYDYLSATGYVQRDLTPRIRVRAIARLGQLNVPETGFDSQELAFGLGVERDWTERWSTSLDIGPSRIRSEGDWQPVTVSYRGRIDGKWERTQLALSAQRTASPTAGRGLLETRSDVEVRISRSLAERWSAEAVAAATLFERDASAAVDADSRSYSRLYAAVLWRASPEWSYRLSLGHERQDSADVGSGTRMMLGAIWNGRVKALSR
jgi:hypothetical protein